MSWIYLYLACCLTHVGAWLNLIPWDCDSLTSWAISTSPRLYTMVVEDKEAQNHSNISFDKFYVELHDCHFWIHKCSSLQELTHVGRWTQTPSGAPNSWWATSTLSTHTSSTTWATTTSPPKVCHSILEKLYSKSWAKATRQDVNTSRCLNEKWQPHFELKRWVWPMIKWSHLTPKSIYSNIGDFVADHL